MILPESPDGHTEITKDKPYDYACSSTAQADCSELYKRVIGALPSIQEHRTGALFDYSEIRESGDPISLAEKIESLQVGMLYDVYYLGMQETGFFCRFDSNRAVFFCFDCECQGDYLFFPSDETVAVERPDNNLAALARAIYQECESIRWLIEFMKWDNTDFFMKRVYKQINSV
jgi:hypothetical protein